MDTFLTSPPIQYSFMFKGKAHGSGSITILRGGAENHRLLCKDCLSTDLDRFHHFPAPDSPFKGVNISTTTCRECGWMNYIRWK